MRTVVEADETIINIVSGRDPDGPPTCMLSWEGEDWIASVDDVRATAIDLLACASHADMIVFMTARFGLDALTASSLFADMLTSQTGRGSFGTARTLWLTPAGSTKRQMGVVLLEHGKHKGGVDTPVARTMALHWLMVAAASEHDQMFGEALRTAGKLSPEEIEGLFGDVRGMRTDRRSPDPDEAMPTSEWLARTLDAAGDPALVAIARRAREGYYDDFKSPLAAPEHALVADLRAAGRTDLAQRVIDGEFDATREEAEAWAASEEGQGVLRELGLPSPPPDA